MKKYLTHWHNMAHAPLLVFTHLPKEAVRFGKDISTIYGGISLWILFLNKRLPASLFKAIYMFRPS